MSWMIPEKRFSYKTTTLTIALELLTAYYVRTVGSNVEMKCVQNEVKQKEIKQISS